ncbi:hypothetical protein L2E82_27546 [Cichorium intybus]|uniref:Uncharacterized protein n=1 Tax=Cichorium intybus TaxID=13427 RepID=A0ACB9CTJ7_CICIN|nr:hypothetical protein L2E82_27546 [Cichorium intybus]
MLLLLSVSVYIFMAAFEDEILLDDFLIAENSPYQSDVNTPVLISERTNRLSTFDPLTSDNGPKSPSSGAASMDKESMDRLVEAYVAEAKAANAVWQAAQAHAATPERCLLRMIANGMNNSNSYSLMNNCIKG